VNAKEEMRQKLYTASEPQ